MTDEDKWLKKKIELCKGEEESWRIQRKHYEHLLAIILEKKAKE